MSEITTTPAEAAAIARLRRLAKTWPKTLQLFGWSGSLVVVKRTPGAKFGDTILHKEPGIECGGGDPNADDVFD